ncbi:hypothetical protein GJ689_00810 [Rhodoplanes serenus]|uniref:Uncharacterized protein n=1 Tax=Rhodoplanes serenus TaxID=200615 RepID=A0A9X4XLF9_9BRAD|nr:hypothetical protein [Rhodoplanes serenus]MTW14756.1 hypothetical protein [Rhodoplanes serenus]
MRGIKVVGAALLALGLLVAADSVPAAAQSGLRTDEPARRAARAPTRIQVTPTRRLYRECVDWLAVERRPSGDVITPQMRCRWAYR